MNLTDHFLDTELGVAGCDERLTANAQFICQKLLEPMRDKFGPILVHDGYRDPGHNARVGGKAASFHLFEEGKAAADVSSATVANRTMFDWLRLESGLPFDKVILEYNEKGFAATVHVQIDQDNEPRREAFTGSTGDGKDYVPQRVL
jgi:zinc D-Ala-D-Ala carboxypeptidase